MGNINTSVREKLEYLAKLPETDFPFITIYLNVNADEFLANQERNRIYVKNFFQKMSDEIRADENKERLESFGKDENEIRNFIEKELDTKTHGLAIFACDKLGVFETFQSIRPFENELVVDSYPHLKQLALQADEYEKALVIMTDAKYSRIFDVRLGGTIIEKANIESILHRNHSQGGWSQLRYQRHIEKQIEDHYIETASIAVEIAEAENFQNIILIGQEHEIKNFERHLPKRFTTKIININHLQMRENINTIIQTIIDDLYQKEQQEELKKVMEVIDRSNYNDRATVGIQDISELARQGRVNTLLVSKNKTYQGYKCGECLYISKDQHQPGCPECNGNTRETDLIEATIRNTFKNGGYVELVEKETEAADELEKHGGIAATLNY